MLFIPVISCMREQGISKDAGYGVEDTAANNVLHKDGGWSLSNRFVHRVFLSSSLIIFYVFLYHLAGTS